MRAGARDNSPEAARRRVAGHKIQRQYDQLRAAHAREHTLGQGIGYGFVAVAVEAAPGLVALRVAGGLRWVGAAVVAGRVAEQVSWAGAEGELIGGRAAWQGYKANSRAFLGQSFVKGVADYGMQVSANYVTGSKAPNLDVNIIESAMAGVGIRPVAIGIGSAAFNLNSRLHLKTVLPLPGVERIAPASFAAQAGIGVLMGYGGGWAEHALGNSSRTIALGVYMNAALRVGPRVAYPLGLGLSHLVPHLLGTTEEALEGTADNYLTPADSAATAPRP